MAISPRSKFRSRPTDDLQWGRFVDQAQATPADGEVTDESFADRGGNSVIGRATGTSGKPADISLSNNQFLVNRGGTLTGGGLLLADMPSGLATDAEVTAAAAVVTAAFQAADAVHVAAPDPHPQYRLEAANVPYTEVSGKPAALGLLYSGTGSPESVVTAGVGSLFLRTDGGAGTTLYVKESGAGNTGWIGK